MLPNTLMTALGAGGPHTLTVMLAYVPEGIDVRFPEATSPPVHVYGIGPQRGGADAAAVHQEV